MPAIAVGDCLGDGAVIAATTATNFASRQIHALGY